jgi:integrase
MRRGEILNIRAGHIDLDRRVLQIPETKTDVPRAIPLSGQAAGTLALLRDQALSAEDRIFPVTANAFRLAWERCRRRAAREVQGIEDLRFHDLRHEAVSRFFEAGLSLPEVAAISGHREPRMLLRYTHLRPEDIAQKLRLLANDAGPE